MARLTLGLWLAFVLLLWTPDVESQTEDIKSIVNQAMRQLYKDVRETTNQVKRNSLSVNTAFSKMQKMLTDVYNKSGDLEPLTNITSGIDKHLTDMETLLLHEEERDNSTQKQTKETLEDIKNSIETLTSDVESNKAANAVVEAGNHFIEVRLNSTDSKIDDLKSQIENLTQNFNEENVRKMCLSVIDMSPLTMHISAMEELLKRYELKLEEYRGNADNSSELARQEEERHDQVMEEMKRQGVEIAKIQTVLSTAEGAWKEMPKLTDLHDLQAGTNQTMDAVIRAADSLNENTQTSMVNLTRHLGELSARLVTTNETVQRSVAEVTKTNIVINDITTALDKMHQEMTKKDHKLTETSDGVKQNKKEIENAAKRVIAQVRQFTTLLGFTVNNTLHLKLNEIENSMAGQQSALNAKLYSKIDVEMTELWRQFSAIDREIRENKEDLHRLTEHTDAFTNSSTSEMKEVKGEVNKVSSRVLAISDNLGETLVQLRRTTAEISRMMDADALSAGMEFPSRLERIPAE